MNFELSDEQQQLADSVAKFLSSEYDLAQRQAIQQSASGFSERTWATLAELGLMALALPEDCGGFGGNATDLMAPMEACGDALLLEPLLDHVAWSARLVAPAARAAQRAALMPGLADGSQRVAFAYLEPGRRYELNPVQVKAQRKGTGWVLNGSKSVVIGAPMAQWLVVSATSAEGASLFIVDSKTTGLSFNPSRTVDGLRCADVELHEVQLSADALLGSAGSAQPLIEAAVDFATALQCADAVGAMRYALDATLEYTKTRKQFGMPIASFQVLQHRMVEMLITLEQSRSMAILAAARVDSGGSVRDRSRAVSAAKIKIADAARLISQEAVQLHGGMGMTEELKISHTFRRLTMATQRFGDADHHLERFAALDTLTA